MGLFLKMIRWAGTKQWFGALGRRILTPLDKVLGRRGHTVTSWTTGLPVGHLTTTGRVSGNPRTAPLLFVEREDTSVAIVGTNFGGADHPNWASNLLANPHARWKVHEEIAVSARQATDDEYATLWPRFVSMWPGYEGYVSRSQRIPLMFVLEIT